MDFLFKLDLIIKEYLSYFTILPNYLNLFFNYIGSIQIHLVLIFILLICSYLKSNEFYKKKFSFFFRLCLLFCILYVLKITIARTRPEFLGFELEKTLLARLFDTRLHSFPSSHAAISGFYIKEYPKSTLLKILCFFVCFSRLSSFQHFFFDVICGFFIGFYLNPLTRWFYKKSINKLKKAAYINKLPFIDSIS